MLGVSDRERDGAAAAVAELRRQGVTRVAMLTGDSAPTARAVAARVGVDDVRAELRRREGQSGIEEKKARQLT